MARTGMWFLVCALLTTGCKDKSGSGSGSGSAPRSGSESAPGSGPKVEKKDPAADVKKEAAAFLTRWTDVQNKLDFAAYTALYEPRTFRGIKRTAGGKVKEFDFAGWKKDRERMFVNKFEVATALMDVETWLDKGSKLKRGMTVIRFTQRWRGGKYADHGTKVLHVWRAPDGAQRITYEDLLNSEPGWERVALAVAALPMDAPKTPEEALALWKKLAPTGADYEDKLASIPDDADVRRPMAIALLSGGNFKCTAVVEYAECGDERVEWADFDLKSDFDDACLRRRLAGWALSNLDEGDLPAVESALADLAALEKPEGELPQSVASIVQTGPESVRLAVWQSLLAGGREDEIILGDLSEKGLVAAAEMGIDAAAVDLDPVRHMKQVTELVNAESMTDETRAALLTKVSDMKEPEVKKALAVLAADKNCELAMQAALELDRQGDPSHLPRRKPDQTEEQARQALCMLLEDPDEDRAQARVAEFIDPDGVTVTETVEDPWAEEAREDGGPGDDEEPDPPQKLETVGEVWTKLQDVFGEGDGSWERASVTLTSGKGGWVISDFDFYRYNGCGC